MYELPGGGYGSESLYYDAGEYQRPEEPEPSADNQTGTYDIMADTSGGVDPIDRPAAEDGDIPYPVEPQRPAAEYIGGANDGPPPIDSEPPVGGNPEDVPPPFGIEHFDTDPRYAAEPPVSGEVLGTRAAALCDVHARYVDLEDVGGRAVRSVDLEHQTPAGTAYIKSTELQTLSVDFVPASEDQPATHHVYYEDDNRVVRRYDMDPDRMYSDIPEEGEVPNAAYTQTIAEQTDAERPNIALDVAMGQGARVVGSSELDYVLGLAEVATPLAVPATHLRDIAIRRVESGHTTVDAESERAGAAVRGYVTDILADPASGYALSEAGDTAELRTADEHGNSLDVTVGFRAGHDSNAYVHVRLSQPYPEGAASDAKPYGTPDGHTVTRQDDIVYEIRPGGGLLYRLVSTLDLPGGKLVTSHSPSIVAGDKLEAKRLRNFLRDPRADS